MGYRVDDFLAALSAKHRLLLLGGMAVVRHGLTRYTKDVDVWLDPMTSCEEWASCLVVIMLDFPGVQITRLFPPQPIDPSALSEAIAQDRVIRITGFEMPLDIFREPNELEHIAFDTAFARSEDFQGNLRLMALAELITSKLNTGRAHDREDLAYLESVLEERTTAEMKSCNAERAAELISIFVDHAVLEAALVNPDPAVQELGRAYLRQFAEEGDPFALETWTKHFGSL